MIIKCIDNNLCSTLTLNKEYTVLEEGPEYYVILDDKRNEVAENDIPDVIERFNNLDKETDRKRTEQSFFVPVEEIRNNGYDLSINKYKEIEYEEVKYDSPQEIMLRIRELEMDITAGIEELAEMIGE